jgi:membrane protease YdiL (CAAX protease family)
MTNCPSCGAHAPASASWCGQCYQSLVPTAPSPTPELGQTGDAVGGTARFGIGSNPPLPPPGIGTPDRFGIVRAPGAQAADGAVPDAGGVATLAPVPRWQPTPPPPPGGWQPPTEPDRTGTLGAWGWGSTGFTVIGAILLGGLVQLLFYHLGRNPKNSTETLVRYEIVALVLFYGAVAAVVIQRVTAGKVRLFWTDGKPLHGVLIGGGIGLTLGLVLLGINSAVNGHLSTDPGVSLMTSEGDIAHILAAVLLTMIAAPLVEETLFRGLLAESLRRGGRAKAIWLSALAFACWHWRPDALRYYALMGAMFAVLYLKRGLVCSMATHACFNGVLTVAAIVLALTPGQSVHGAGFQFTAPRGWHSDTNLVDGAEGVHLLGPSGSDVFVSAQPTGQQEDVQTVLRNFDQGRISQLAGGELSAGAPHEEDLPAGPAVVADVTIRGEQGKMVLIPEGTEVIVIGFGSGGSAKADQDFRTMLQTLQVS